MRANWRDRLGFWLERFERLRPLLMERKPEYDSRFGLAYINKINGHVVIDKDGLT